jgi:ribosomal 50S subunit-recycling heat shock protein
MKKLLLALVVVMIGASLVFAAGPKTYQVTGPVLEMKGDIITVEKGKEKWEISKDAATKVTGDLKVGSKVTIEYTMKAATIEVKDAGKKVEKKEKEEKKEKKEKEEPKKK